MKTFIYRCIMMLGIIMSLNNNLFGQYFQQFLHNTGTYPNQGINANCRAGLQLTGSTQGIITIANSDLGFLFNSLYPNGVHTPFSTDNPCAPSASGFQSYELVWLSTSNSGIPYYLPVVEDIVEVEPAYGIMAVLGHIYIPNEEHTFISLMEPTGKVYSTIDLNFSTDDIIGKAICFDNANSMIYVTGYTKNNSNVKKILAIKLEYLSFALNGSPALNLVWSNEYEIASSCVPSTSFINPVGEDIIAVDGGNKIFIISNAEASGGLFRPHMLEIEPSGNLTTTNQFDFMIDYPGRFKQLGKIASKTDEFYVVGDGFYESTGRSPLFGNINFTSPSIVINRYQPNLSGRFVKSFILSNNGYAYLFGNEVNEQDAYLLPINHTSMNSHNEIRFMDRMNNTVDIWNAVEITEDVNSNYLTLHGSYNDLPSTNTSSTVIDNIYHNGIRGVCGDIEILPIFEHTEVPTTPVEYCKTPISLGVASLCEFIEELFYTDICSTSFAADGSYDLSDPVYSLTATSLSQAKVVKKPTTLYPNPFKANLLLQHAQAGKTVSVLNITGKEIMTIVITQDGDVTLNQLNALTAGIYFVKIDNTVIKLVKE